MFRILLLSLFALALSACAVAGKQTREVLALPTETLPRKAEVRFVPFVNQSTNYCGPASLAMVMQWAGEQVTADQLAPEVFTQGGKGSLQTDLISASRRHGLVAIPLEGMQALLQEVAAGHPVIVLENMGLSFLPRWHYAVVFGYDLDSQELTMHSGKNAFAREYLNRFEWNFKHADYWSLVVLPPDQLSATASAVDHLHAAVGLEQADRNKEADQAYQKILERWPTNLGALIGLGNVAYKEKNYSRAVSFLKKACKLHPESEEAKHNLAVAEKAIIR